MTPATEKTARRIYLARGNDQLGRAYTPEKVKSYLASGVVHPRDMAWSPGMSDWAPVIHVLAAQERGDGSSMVSEWTAAEMGAACFEIASSFQESYSSVIQELQQTGEGNKLDLAQVWVELICFGVYAVDYAIQAALEPPQRDAVVRAYREHLRRLKLSGVTDFYDLVKNRMLMYSHLARRSTTTPRALAWQMAEEFTHFCKAPKNRRLTTVAITLFDRITDHFAEWIRTVPVESLVE